MSDNINILKFFENNNINETIRYLHINIFNRDQNYCIILL